MKSNKPEIRVWVTDKHLSVALRIAASILTPLTRTLVNNQNQHHLSH